MRAGIYIRVSTEEQAREGYSIRAQEERLKKYAEAKDYTIHKSYIDAGKSGANTDRSGLQSLIADVEFGLLDVIIVYKLDRLSRRQSDTLRLIQDIFQKNGVAFISLSESFDTSTPFGIAMIGILAVFAELERSTIIERNELGRVQRAKEGYYHGGGKYDPLGYHYRDGMLHLNPEEKPIIEDIFKWYLDGNSMNETARRAVEKYSHRIKSFTIVKSTLQQPIYTGRVQFKGKVYDGLHERIISDEDFEKAQAIRKSRAVGATRTNKRKGLLVGHIYCARCGARYRREVTGSQKYRYIKYACYSKSHARATAHMIKDRNCDNKRWNEADLDKVVIDFLKKLDFEDYQKKHFKAAEPIDYDNLLYNVETELERIVELFSIQNMPVSAVQKKVDELNVRKSKILNDKRNAELKKKNPKSKMVRSLIDFNWDEASKETLIKIVDTIVGDVYLDGDNVDIELSF